MLMAAFMVIYRGYTYAQAYKKFRRHLENAIPYCHAGKTENAFEIQVIDCLRAIEFALYNRWYSPETFDTDDYFRIGKLAEGDM